MERPAAGGQAGRKGLVFNHLGKGIEDIMILTSQPSSFNISSGTASDGGWRAWWRQQSQIDGTNWVSLLAAADAALRDLRILHGASS